MVEGIHVGDDKDFSFERKHYYKMRPSSLWVSLDFE
jgi:hypothetical protein